MSQIRFKKVIQVRCARSLWPVLGWRPDEHPYEVSEEPKPLQIAPLVPTQWAYGQPRRYAEELCRLGEHPSYEHPSYEQKRIKFKLVCGPV